MASPIKTPFDALIHEVLDKIRLTTGLSYDAKQMVILRIPATENFFAALEFYTTDDDDKVRVHVYLQQGTTNTSSKLQIEKQSQFYCSKYNYLYKDYGDTTKVYSYVRNIDYITVIDEILQLPTICSTGIEFLVTEDGRPILTNDSINISVNAVYNKLVTNDNLILTTESNQPINVEV